MAGLVPAIHAFCISGSKAWMPGTRPGMTWGDGSARIKRAHFRPGSQDENFVLVENAIALNQRTAQNAAYSSRAPGLALLTSMRSSVTASSFATVL
ncbi:hypothetical protein D4Q52_04620 [Rhodopseudomonas palustris]|uniref:Uncharacterized protein n=1 Tax=Rhodopseudomonas palustris TaxID=1076 RepID=A0A418VLS5_RHOPL|nr:hypothetical protein D4Q52_04620 [Rhodopseudomonas palustris]